MGITCRKILVFKRKQVKSRPKVRHITKDGLDKGEVEKVKKGEKYKKARAEFEEYMVLIGRE